MFKKILIGLVVALALLAGVISTRPDTFTVERSVTVQAPPELVFALVNDFHRWNEWSPWDHMDPDMKRTFEGATAGAGAMYSWTGNSKVGEGRMTVEESKPNEQVRIKLDFLKPMTATNNTTFTFTRQGEATQVKWLMDGKNNFMSKAMQMVMNMDKMVGGDFEKGLAAMKQQAEADAKKLAEQKALAEKAAADAAVAAAAAAAAAPPAAEATATAPAP